MVYLLGVRGFNLVSLSSNKIDVDKEIRQVGSSRNSIIHMTP